MREVTGRGFCLLSTAISDHKYLVTFYTREIGLVKGVIRLGSGKKFSRTLLTPLVEVDLVLRGREHQELNQVVSIEPISNPMPTTASYVRLALFQTWCQLLAGSQAPEQPDDHVYRLVASCTQAVAQSQDVGQLILAELYFEYWLLRLNGWLPSVHTPNLWTFDVASGHISYADTPLAKIDSPIEPSEFKKLAVAAKVNVEHFLALALEWQGLTRVFVLFGELWQQHLTLNIKARRTLMDLFSEHLKS